MTSLFKFLAALILAVLIGLALIRYTNLVVPSVDHEAQHIQSGDNLNTLDTTSTIQLFYYREDLDRDETGNILCSADAVQAVSREISDYSIGKHIQLLLDGPNQAEQSQGFSSEFPLSGFVLEHWDLDNDGVLVLSFADPDLQTVGGSCRVGILASQVIKTLETITGVQEITIEPVELFQP